MLQNIFTGSKIVALIGLIILGFLLVKNNFWAENMSFGWSAFSNLKTDSSGNLMKSGWESISGMTIMGGIAAAMVGSVFSSVAWENVTFVSGEIENPKKECGSFYGFGNLCSNDSLFISQFYILKYLK